MINNYTIRKIDKAENGTDISVHQIIKIHEDGRKIIVSEFYNEKDAKEFLDNLKK